jgi:hypothetical protein
MKNSNEKEIKISDRKLIDFLSKELNNQHKKREEKIAEIMAFCLDYLNQFEKEDWKKRRNSALLLLTMAETEWKSTKKQVFESYVNKEIIKNMKF